MSRRYQAFDARNRRPVDDDDAFDERGVLRDGCRSRTPMWAMDSLQKAVAAGAGRVASTYEEEEEADAMTTDAQLAMHRPGYRTSTHVSDDAAVEAYRQYVADQANAWRKRDGQPPGSYPRSAGVGSRCTVNGQDGVLVESEDGQWLVCKPVARQDGASTGPVYDRAVGEHLKQQAWQEMVDEQREAWRKR